MNEAGQFVPQDWWAIIFNPSFPYRLVHTVLAAYLTTALVVGGVGAWHLLRDRDQRRCPRHVLDGDGPGGRRSRRSRSLPGDMHGLNTLEHQPAKVMAMEGHFESYPKGAPLILFGLPDQEAGTVRLRAFDSQSLFAHSQARPQRALERSRYRRPCRLALCAYRVLVVPHHGRARFSNAGPCGAEPARPVPGKLYDWRLLHRFALVMCPSGFVAVIAGWVTTEVGRQPFTVYGLAENR